MSCDFKNELTFFSTLFLLPLWISVQKDLKRDTSTDEAATTIQKGTSDEE